MSEFPKMPYPTESTLGFGFANALVETVRLLGAIDKKLYVIIKKLEEQNGEQKKEVYAEDMGYEEDEE